MNTRTLMQTLAIAVAIGVTVTIGSAMAFGQDIASGRTRGAQTIGTTGLTAPVKATEIAPVLGLPKTSQDPKSAIVGSWLITLGNGFHVVVSFTADGLVTEAGQGDVVAPPTELSTFSAGHGAWTSVGDRQFAITIVILQYDIVTSEYLGQFKVHQLLKVNEEGDQLSGPDRLQIVNPDGSVIDIGSSGTMNGARIKAEPFN